MTLYQFGDFRFDSRTDRLTRAGDFVPLQPRPAGVLRMLIERPGHLVTRERFLEELWPDVYVSDNALDQLIRRVRRILDDPRFVVTVPRRGYRFTDDVMVVTDDPPWASFIGRDAELRALEAALVVPSVVALVGTGGVGKTRLAREVLRRAAMPGWFVELASARTRDDIVRQVAAVLAIPLSTADPVRQVADTLVHRSPALLILDNAEQVTSHARSLVQEWHGRAPNLSILVTTRVGMRIPGEREVRLDPLDPLSARRLFEERALAVRPEATLAESRQSIDELVGRLDCLPLAIEMVAARSRLFGPRDLLALVTERIEVVRLPGGDATERHASLEATLAWSWDLLSPWARAALAQSSVFRSGFSIASFLAVVDLSAFPEAPAVDEVLQELHDASLVRAEALASGWMRYRPFEVVRVFARARLAEVGAAEARHAAFFAALGTDEAIAALRGAGGVERGRRLAEQLEELVAAAGRDVDAIHAARCCAAAAAVIERSGPFAAGVAWVDGLMGRDDLARPERARALAARGRLLQHGARSEEAARSLEEAAELHQELGEIAAAAGALGELGAVQRGLGRHGEGQASLQLGMHFARQSGDIAVEARLLGLQAIHDVEAGRTEEARVQNEQALAIFRETGDQVYEGRVLGNLGVCLLRQGRVAEGRACYERALEIRRETGDRTGEGWQLTNLGHLHLESGRLDEAERCYAEALDVAREIGHRRHEATLLVSQGVLHATRGEWDKARRHAERAIVVARAVGFPKIEGAALDNLGQWYLLDGRLEEAEEVLRRAVRLFEEVGNGRHQGIALGNLAEVVLASGRSADASPLLAEGERLLREAQDRYYLANLLCTRATRERADGEQRAFVETLSEIETLVDQLALEPDAPLGEKVAALRGRPDQGPS